MTGRYWAVGDGLPTAFVFISEGYVMHGVVML